MAAHSMRASSRQASTAELTIRWPLELLWGSVGYRPGYGLRLQAHGARKAVRMRVTGAHIEWRTLQLRCGRERKPPRSVRTSLILLNPI